LDQIDIKFSNKVILDVGLCISLFDFIEVGDPFVYPAEGSAHQRVKFRMVVFRPFAGEVEDFHLCFQIIQYYPLNNLL
jgi:DNA-directed RNA polymerase III subunit RPC8